MNKTLLKFPSPVYLIAFRKYSKAKTWEVSLSDLTVFCDCSPKEAKSACQDFQAILLTEMAKAEPVVKTESIRKAHLTAFISTDTQWQTT
jgi:hypothetical protein